MTKLSVKNSMRFVKECKEMIPEPPAQNRSLFVGIPKWNFEGDVFPESIQGSASGVGRQSFQRHMFVSDESS